MASPNNPQGFGVLPPGSAPYSPRPSSPRGLYRTFGAPESLLRIHFPNDDPNNNPNTSNPWYWWITQVHPNYFSFFAPGGWVRGAFFPIIKILQIDPRKPIPTPAVGFTSIEAAIAGWNPDIFGRFDEREQKFWDLITHNDDRNPGQPRSKPLFNVVKGQVQARTPGQNINATIKSAINRFLINFNGLAQGYNVAAGGVSGGGFHYTGQTSGFNFPLPNGPPANVLNFQKQLNAFVSGPPYGSGAAYIGPVSATAFFNINTFTTQAQAFGISIGQLDPNQWNMSVFPPVQAKFIGNGRPSGKTNDYSGYGPTPFPLHGLEIM